jgi:hypothetical protein
MVALHKLRPELLTRGLALRIWHRTQQCACLSLVLRGDGIEHVSDPVVPTALLRRGGLLLGQGRPDAQMAIGDGTAPRLQPAGAQIPEDRAP